MPEIKHNFTGGKMNKDVDERLVPNGQYEHAMNIQVSTSEGSEVGTVQNILGNSMPQALYQIAGVGNNSLCVGSVVDEKNDAFYYFVKSGGTNIDFTQFTSSSPQGANGASKDVIFQYKNEVITPVFVATSAFAYTIYGNGISWDSAAGTITFGSQHDVSDLSVGMQLIASGFNSAGFPVGLLHNFIININPITNTISLFGDLTWLDNSTSSYHYHNTKLFFTNNGSADFNTMLGFTSNNIITGINIVDDMLFWVDGHYNSNGELIGSEPKKINIPRSIAGTVDVFTHTTFLNDTTGAGTPAQEKHITVIKENPKNPPSMVLESIKPVSKATMGECEISFEDVVNNPGELLIPGDSLFGVPILHSVTNGITPFGTANNLDVEFGDIMSLQVFPDAESNISFPLKEPTITVRVINTYISSAPNANGVFTTLIDLEIQSISASTPIGLTKFLIDLKLENKDRILKFKFPKFAVRYKYQDNEYSAFSPFTQVAFVPLTWDYKPKKGQNLGMQNHLKRVTLSNIVPSNIPHGVVQVDILYKESGSSNIYLVDQIKPDDGTWQWQNDLYTIESELIYAVVAENQILRHYDNVPKIARAQEVTGSRIVYGNYKQNYTTLGADANVRFDLNLIEHNITQDGGVLLGARDYPHFWDPSLTVPLRSIKSLREYQLGVVFEDKYGRQSPVMTSSESTLKVPKEEASKSNLLEVKTLNNPPDWAESFRFFIKEPSTEYYNLAMDRWYDAEDGNVWLSFPSLDRNKLTEEDTIILKKNINNNQPITDTSEYKVIAISNEVPDFVKTSKVSYGIEEHATNTLMGTSAPVPTGSIVLVDPAALTNTGTSGSSLIHAFDDWRDAELIDKRLWLRFHKTTTPRQYSNWYEITTMDEYQDSGGTIATTALAVRIQGQFKDDVSFMNVGGGFVGGAALEIARSVETPYAQFDGRFFVKILRDLNLEQSILTYSFDAGYSTVGMLTPRFLRYDGIWHSEAYMSGYNTGTYNIGSGAAAGDYAVFGNNPESGGWLTPSNHRNPAYYDYNGANSVGLHTDYQTAESFQDDRWTNTHSIWGYSRRVSTFSHGKNQAGSDAAVNIFPKPYPFMLGAFNGTGCVPYATTNPPVYAWYTKALVRTKTLATNNFWDTTAQQDTWFIDMEPTYYFPADSWNNGEEEYYARPDLALGYNNNKGITCSPDANSPRGLQNTPGVGARLGSRRMDISYVGPDYIPKSGGQPGLDFQNQQNVIIHDFLTSSEPVIQFNGDPGQIKYKVVDYRIVEEIQNIPDDTSCGGGSDTSAMMRDDGSVMSLASPGVFRVRYELLLDQVIGTTVQDQGIITPIEYILAGGTPDENNNYTGAGGWGSICCNGTPVYARKYTFYPPDYENVTDRIYPSIANPNYSDYDTRTGCYSGAGTPTVQADVYSSCPDQDGAFYDQTASPLPSNTYNSGAPVYIDPNIWVNKDGTTRLGYIPTQSVKTHTFSTLTHDVSRGNEIPITSDTWAAKENWESGILFQSIYGSNSFGQSEHEASYNPAIWETLPTDPVDLELYYEASKSYPMDLFKDNSHLQIAPAGSEVSCYSCNAAAVIPSQTTIQLWINNTIYLSQSHGNTLVNGDIIKLTNLDGSYITVVVDNTPTANEIEVEASIYNSKFGLSWHNCFSFGNGVESDRISDTFNSDTIGKGVRVSTVLEKDYKEEHRKYGLIYSGLYNSTSGVNSLNQFITAEKVTKDVNPIYGSIQKLHSRNTDLITLCEDKVLKILANKDAVFNADGNIQLTATGNVLGQTVPFVGEYGISKNPESFASESYRAYFTDKVRGAVVRLSRDGLTPISDAGMKDWFRDHFNLVGPTDNVIGSYDDYKGEYNLTLYKSQAGSPSISKPETLTYREDVKGWVSFKSFVYENALSCANKYYTFSDGYMYEHHLEVDDSGTTVPRNQFYGTPTASSLSFYLNDFPSTVKSFHTLSYEGSKSRVIANLQDNDYYNLQAKDGWYVQRIETDKEGGTVDEFIEKEGKWFNYIKGDDIPVNNCGIITNQVFDQSSFAMQGLGILTIPPVSVAIIAGCMDPTQANFNPLATVDDGSCVPYVYGCMEPTADNYNSVITNDDGSCQWHGCTDATALNATTFPSIAYTYNSGVGIVDDGSCIATIPGCTNCGTYWESQNVGQFCNGISPAVLQGAFNYDPLANFDDGSCVAVQFGCMYASAFNTSAVSPPANVDPGYCQWYGCTIHVSSYFGLGAAHGPDQGLPFPPEALTYVPYNWGGGYGIIDDGSCIDVGCPDTGGNGTGVNGSYDTAGNPSVSTYPGYPASNYGGAGVTIDDGSCVWDTGCTISFADNFSATTPPPPSPYAMNNTCIIGGCTDPTAQNYNCNFIADPGSLVPCTGYTVTYNDMSCTYPANPGCTDPPADNYDGPNPPFQDDGSCVYCSTAGLWFLDNVTNTTIDVNIDPSLLVAPNNATIDWVYIKYRIQGTSAWTFIVVNPLSPTASTHTITGLTPSTVYEVTVEAQCPSSISYPNPIQAAATAGVITGCMDATLNNDGSYAAANYDPFANTAGPCDPYNCPIVSGTVSTIYNYYNIYSALDSTVYAFADITVTISYVTNTTGGNITSSLIQFGTWVLGQSITFADVNALVNPGDTFIHITSSFDTTDGSCPESIVDTLVGGCTDPTMFNYDPNAHFENGTCVPVVLGCTDATACNDDCATAINPGSSSPCTDGVNTNDGSCIYGTATLWYASSTSCYIGPSCNPGTLGTAYLNLNLCCTDNPSLCM